MKNNVINFKGDGTIEGDLTSFDYTILFAEDVEDLEQLIRGCLDNGWRRHGASFIAAQGMGYCQAMRYRKKIEGVIDE